MHQVLMYTWIVNVAFNVATAQYVKQVCNISFKQNGTKLSLLCI